jgi:radical SAM superfamily enzyme with C-terminal helix-hairpin-helix motif
MHLGTPAAVDQFGKRNMKAIRITAIAILALGGAPLMAEGLLNANTASEAELGKLPHVDAAMATEIVANRPYATWGSLDKMLQPHLGGEQREELYGHLFVPLKLNSASDADIQLIPGVGGRMAHEFEEYRPYTSMQQFRREIGKYVDEDEVARYEQYVVLE